MTAHPVTDDVVDVAAPVDPSAPHSEHRVPGGHLVGLAIACLLVLVAFLPIVVGGRTLSAAGKNAAGTNGNAPFPGQPSVDYSSDFRVDQGASTWALEPWAEVTHRIYADGELPLWNPYQAAGAPHAANMQSAVFDPLLLAVNLYPTPLTWDIAILGAFLLGAASAYLFGRTLGLGIVPAVLSSATYSLSGWFFLYSNNGFSRSYAFLPLLFLLVELTLRSRGLWPVLVLGVAIAGDIYVGMPEASFFVVAAATAYAVMRLVQERAATPMRTSVGRLGGAALLGLLLAAPLLLLFFQYELLSFNVHKPDVGKGSEAEPAWGILHWIVPWFPDAPSGPKSWVGTAAVVSALVAISGRRETRRLHAWFFLALGGLLLLKIYDFGVLTWVGSLPVANLVVFPTFAAPVVAFSCAVLSGIGVQVLLARDLRLRRFLVTVGAIVAVLVLALSVDHRFVEIVEQRQNVWGRGVFFGVMSVVAAVLASRLRRRRAAYVLAGLVVFELFILAPFDIYAKRADPFRPPGWMPLVRSAQGGDPQARVFAIDDKLYPNTAGALGLQDVRVLDALYVDRYWRYLLTFIQPDAHDRFTGSDGPPARWKNNPMFDALGVRAVLSERDLGNVPGLRFLGRSDDTRVYENTRAFPRMWVVHEVHAAEDEDDAFAFLEAHAKRRASAAIVDTFDPRRQAVVEDASQELRSLPNCPGAARDRASIERYSATSLTVRVDAACAGLLVLPDTYFPGWQATVNGRDSAIHPTDGAFRGVAVPAGPSVVEFRYAPRAFPIGIASAVLGLLAFGLLAVLRWRRGGAARGPSGRSP